MDIGRLIYVNDYNRDLFMAYEQHREDGFYFATGQELILWDQNTWGEFTEDQQWYFGIIQQIINRAVVNGARLLRLAAEHMKGCDCNKDKEEDQEQKLESKQPNPQFNVQKFFLYLNLMGTGLSFIFLGKMLGGSGKKGLI